MSAADAAATGTPAAEPPRTGPLHAEHLALGAQTTDFGGWLMPLRYGSELAEHRAVRSAAGLFDLSHMGEVEVTGPGAAAALDAATVSEASAVAVGRAKYTLLCAEDGGVVDDLVLYRRGVDRYLVVPNAANTAAVVAALTDRGAGFEAVVTDASDRTAMVAVQGPRAGDVLARVLAGDDRERVLALRGYAAADAGVLAPGAAAGVVPAFVARTGYTGEDGFEVYAAAEHAVPLWRALLAAGADHGLVPVGLAARDSLRLEAGMPLYGHELGRGVDPRAAGLGRVVALDRPGDFVGRAALARLAAAPPSRVLVGLRGSARRPARAGQVVLRAGAPVGEVTSGAPSPTLGHPIAMAFVAAGAAAPGTALEVDVRGRREPFEVVALPFYRRAR